MNDKSRDNWALYKRLFVYVKPYRARLIGGIVFGVLYGPANGAVLQVVRKAWAWAFESNWSYPWWQMVGIAVLLPVAMIARGTFDFLGTYLLNWVGLRVVMDMRVRLFEHLESMSLDFFTDAQTGELISRVTNDVGLVQQSISTVVEDVVKQPVALISVLAWLVYTDWKLTAAALVLFPICLIPITIFGRKTRKASRASQRDQASLLAVLHEAIVGLRVIKAFSMEEREAADFRKLCRDVFTQRMRVIRARALSSPMIEVVSGFGGMAAFLYAYHVQVKGSELVSMGLGLFMLYEPVKKLSRVHLQIEESMGGTERIFQLLDTKPTVVESPRARVLPPLRQSIRFENVSFSYGENGAALESVNVEVLAGTVVAVVGASGAGKTTLFNLVPRFYDPTSGAVKIDGVDIREGTFQSLRDQIGLVTQETFLFNDTVGVNIAYGKPGATQEEIISAAKRAHADEFIMQTPHGYDTVIGEAGMRLSGGQRQRLAIARAVLKNPPILLLDEATSALDTESERVVQAALDELMWGSPSPAGAGYGATRTPSPQGSGFGGAGGQTHKAHTMLVIAHRLSTVQHADRIIVLEKGRVVEEGTHDHLLARGRVYKRLYELQFSA
ncbi:MAG: ABC transporter ATP-binding protein [Verrucomicrobiia bacterium]